MVKAAKIARAFNTIRAADPVEHDNLVSYLKSNDPQVATYTNMMVEAAVSSGLETIEAIKVIHESAKTQPVYQQMARSRAPVLASPASAKKIDSAKLSPLEFQTRRQPNQGFSRHDAGRR